MATSKKIYIGQKAKEFDTSPRKNGYDMVVMLLDDNNYITSPAVTVSNASAWDSQENGEYKFTYTVSNNKWLTPNNTYANAAALTSNYGLTLVYGNATSPKAGDVITVRKTTVNNTQNVTAALSRSGNVLEFECPLVKPEQRQDIADKILQSVAGYEYQPYSASGVHLEPATEIGDAITAFGVLGGIYDKNTQYGRLTFSDIASTWYEESEEETGYQSAMERKYSRRFAETAAELSILADRITSVVSDAEFESAIEQLSNAISAKVSGTGGDTSSFAWSLSTSGFSLYANGAEVFRCDRGGITVTGDGTFTGNVYASNIKNDAIDGYGGSLYGGAITGGTLGTVQCTEGVQGSLGMADFFGSAIQAGTNTYPQNFTAAKINAYSAFYSGMYKVQEQGEVVYDLTAHYHSFTEQSGKIYMSAPTGDSSHANFNIADTATYKAAVPASRAVLYCNATNYTDVSSGYDCDMTGASYHYDVGGYTYGRLAIRNSSGQDLKTIRVKLPASSGSATVDSFVLNGNPGWRSYPTIGTANNDYIDVGVKALDANGNSMGTGVLRFEVTDLLVEAAQWGAENWGGCKGHVEITSTSGNSAFVKIYDSSWNAVAVGSSSVGKWITAGTSETFGS